MAKQKSPHVGGTNNAGALTYPQYTTKRTPKQTPTAILEPMLHLARRRLHGERDAQIEGHLLALWFRWRERARQ